MIRPAQPADLETVRGFLREYAGSLSFDLTFQDFESEVADPLGFYELVLLTEGGCVALRRIDELTCEMKRLFVRPAARGSGLGRQLAEAVVVEARARGYRRIMATAPSSAAQFMISLLTAVRQVTGGRPPPTWAKVDKVQQKLGTGNRDAIAPDLHC